MQPQQENANPSLYITFKLEIKFELGAISARIPEWCEWDPVGLDTPSATRGMLRIPAARVTGGPAGLPAGRKCKWPPISGAIYIFVPRGDLPGPR